MPTTDYLWQFKRTPFAGSGGVAGLAAGFTSTTPESLQSFYIKTDNLPMPELNIVLLIRIRQAFKIQLSQYFHCSINQLPQPLPAFEARLINFYQYLRVSTLKMG
ncbi:MAG: hypothetical protein R2881_00330 [Eubacteriales bacterium]